MKALTLWRPWPAAIFHLPPDERKPVENRSWAPPPRVTGTRIAIHAGKTFDSDAFASVVDLLRDSATLGLFTGHASDEGVIGTALIAGWIATHDGRVLGNPVLRSHSDSLARADAEEIAASDWYSGPYGWVLRDPIALPEPVPCRGAQGLWSLPPDVEARVLEQERIARTRSAER